MSAVDKIKLILSVIVFFILAAAFVVAFYLAAVASVPWSVVLAFGILLLVSPFFSDVTEVTLGALKIRKKVSMLEEKMKKISVYKVEKITNIESDTIILNNKPIPDTVVIYGGSSMYLGRPKFGFEIDGNKIKISKYMIEKLYKRIKRGTLFVTYATKLED